MKKLLVLSLAIIMIFVSACNTNAPDSSVAPDSSAAPSSSAAPDSSVVPDSSAAPDSSTAPSSEASSEAAPAASIGEWTITVVTKDGENAFTSADAAKLTPISMEATTKNKKGEESTSAYIGAKLADILATVGVSDFTSLTIEASDGFAADYDKTLAMADDTILAWSKDGKAIKSDSPLQMAPKTGVGNQFVKSVAKIIVNA